jgi:hypothetical protein
MKTRHLNSSPYWAAWLPAPVAGWRAATKAASGRSHPAPPPALGSNITASTSQEWRGSVTMRPTGSPKTVAACWNETPCFATLDYGFPRVHSNSIATVD